MYICISSIVSVSHVSHTHILVNDMQNWQKKMANATWPGNPFQSDWHTHAVSWQLCCQSSFNVTSIFPHLTIDSVPYNLFNQNIKSSTHLNCGSLKILLLIDILDFLNHRLHTFCSIFDTLFSRLVQNDFLLVEEALNAFLFKVVQTFEVILLQEKFKTVVTLHFQSYYSMWWFHPHTHTYKHAVSGTHTQTHIEKPAFQGYATNNDDEKESL